MAADDKRGPGAWDAEPRRSVFAALWFRVVLVVIVAGAVGVVAVPRVLDLMNPSPAQPTVAMKPAPSVAPAPMPAVGSGAYWLQVGAFKDPGAAKRLVARLRAQSYHVVEVSTGAANSAPPARSGGAASDRYDVFVVGGSSAVVAA